MNSNACILRIGHVLDVSWPTPKFNLGMTLAECWSSWSLGTIGLAPAQNWVREFLTLRWSAPKNGLGASLNVGWPTTKIHCPIHKLSWRTSKNTPLIDFAHPHKLGGPTQKLICPIREFGSCSKPTCSTPKIDMAHPRKFEYGVRAPCLNLILILSKIVISLATA